MYYLSMGEKITTALVAISRHLKSQLQINKPQEINT